MKEKLVKSLADALEMDAGLIDENDVFRDYENYSSLTELSVIAMLDSDFGIEIEMKEFNNFTTVSDLIGLIDKNSRK